MCDRNIHGGKDNPILVCMNYHLLIFKNESIFVKQLKRKNLYVGKFGDPIVANRYTRSISILSFTEKRINK